MTTPWKATSAALSQSATSMAMKKSNARLQVGV
jgi:hypothetical protein